MVRPDYIDPMWCDCGEQMRFVGVNAAGVSQFFCDNCTCRRDRFESQAAAEKYTASA